MSRKYRHLLRVPILLSGLCVGLSACNKKQSLGGLPEISVPLSKPPAQPTETEVEEAEMSIVEQADPVALRVKQQYQLELYFDKGEVGVSNVTSKLYSSPKLTERRLGRFAVEFWIGDELLERIRFNFPLLAPSSDQDHLESGLKTSTVLEVPFVERATRARILDRQTGQTWPVELPLAKMVETKPSSL